MAAAAKTVKRVTKATTTRKAAQRKVQPVKVTIQSRKRPAAERQSEAMRAWLHGMDDW